MEQKEKLRVAFMSFVADMYDSLEDYWRFSHIRRLTMDRESYLVYANKYFEEYYEHHLAEKTIKFEAALSKLIKTFDKEDVLL